MYCKHPPEHPSYVPTITIENFFEWLRSHGLMYLAYNFEMDAIAYEIEEAHADVLVVRRRKGAIGKLLWSTKNEPLQMVVMQYTDANGTVQRQFALENLSFMEVNQSRSRVVLKFEELEQWTKFLERPPVPIADLLKGLKLFTLRNHKAAQRHYTFLSLAALEFSKVGPTFAAQVTQLEQVAADANQTENCRLESRKLALVKSRKCHTFFNSGRRLSKIIHHFLTNQMEKMDNDQGLHEERPQCKAERPEQCTCPEEMKNIQQRKDAIISAMTKGGSNEMIIEGVAGAGKSTILAEVAAHIYKNRQTEQIVVLAVTNEASENIARKVAEACRPDGFGRAGNAMAFVSHQRIHSSRTAWARHRIAPYTVPSYLDEEMGKESDCLRNLVKNHRIIFSTVDLASSWMNRLHSDQFAPQWILIDEASQLPLMPFFAIVCRGEKFVIAGDSNQTSIISLPDDEYLKAFYGLTSALCFMSRLCMQHSPSFRARHYGMLFVSHRCNTETCALMSNLLSLEHCMMPSQSCQGDRRLAFMKNKSKFLEKIFSNRGFCILHVNGQQINVRQLSSVNIEEALTVCRIVKIFSGIIPEFIERFGYFSLGILSTHQCQVTLLENMLVQEYDCIPHWVEVGTVTSMQGKEYLVTILCCVESSYDDAVASPRAKLGLLSQLEHLHVALTRHTLALIIITNIYRFVQQTSMMQLLLKNLAGDVLYFDADIENGLSCDRQTLTAWEMAMGIKTRGINPNVDFLLHHNK